jgi:DNA repair exonuclease SbcCD ATPase subunit
MASERLAALQAEIEAKQREVERIIAEEAKKNTVPPLIEALEEVVSAQASDTAADFDLHCYNMLQSGRAPCHSMDDQAKVWREHLRQALDEGRSTEEATKRVLFYETKAAHNAAKDKMLRALLNQAREDAETKRANADMFESMRAQMAALQARVTTLEEEKAAKARLAEETIRSLGYSTGQSADK